MRTAGWLLSGGLVFMSAEAGVAGPEHRLAEAVRFETVSHEDPARNDSAAFLALHDHLERVFPRTHASLRRERVNELSLLYRWPGRDASLAPILLTSHLDVVPADPAQRELWTHPPFAGAIEAGHVWGRGTLDDKVGVMATLEAVEGLLADGFVPERTVYLAFGHDEEVGGGEGAAALTDRLAADGVRLAFSLDEGMVITDGAPLGIDAPVALIGVAEKGFLTLRLRCLGQGGHSSMPPPSTAIGCVARAVGRVEAHPLPAHTDGIVGELFDRLGPHLPLGTRLLLSVPGLRGPLLERVLGRNPAANAMLRTTTAVTLIEGGVKVNVLPASATATVNLRVHPADSCASVTEHVRRAVDDPAVEIEVVRATEPSPISGVESGGYRLIERTLRELSPGVIVAPGLVLGGTDSKHYAAVAEASYRFTPSRLGPADLTRAHGVDERVSVENYAEIIFFYRRLLEGAQAPL